MKIAITTVAMLLLTACSSTGIVPMDAGTYMIAKRSAQIGFGPVDGAKADIYREANEFCAKQGKSVETISTTMTNAAFAQPGSASLQFLCK